jgi:hypothetical protein
MGDGIAGEPGNIVDVQFVHHLLPVFFHGFGANAKLGCDLFVDPALGYELQNFEFTRGKLFVVPFDGLSFQS